MSSEQGQQTVYRLADRTSFHSLKPHTEPIPAPTRLEVLLRVKALALNYRDLAIANGTYPFPVKDNVVPVSDCAAEVVDVGEGVTTIKPGDRVVVTFDPTNLYGPQRLGPRIRRARRWVPAAVRGRAGARGRQDPGRGETWVAAAGGARVYGYDDVERALRTRRCQTGTNGARPRYALPPFPRITSADPRRPGTGGVSMTALILLKAFGCSVIVTSSSDAKLRLVRERYDADHTIDYRTTPHWGTEARRLTNGRGVDAVIDNGGAGTIEQSLEAIRMGGLVAVIGFLATPETMPDVAALALGRGAIVRGITVGAKQYLEELVAFVCARGLEVPVDRVFTFERVLDAYEYLASGAHVGKVCIEV